MKKDSIEVVSFLAPFIALAILFSQCSCGKRAITVTPSPDLAKVTAEVIEEINKEAGTTLVAFGPDIFITHVYGPVGYCGEYEIHFDGTGYIFVACKPEYQVIVHELGHVLGLQHSLDRASIMYSHMRGDWDPFSLEQAVGSLITELRAHGLLR